MSKAKKETRTRWREAILTRDGGRCAVCKAAERPDAPLDVHHLLNRHLWPDRAGFETANGATLCPEHHEQAEQTTLTVEAIRVAAGITCPALPPGFDPAASFDTWGNRVLPDGSRIAGPLAEDEGCRRALAAAGVRFVPPVAGSR